MKRIRKVLAFIISLCMLFQVSALQTYAEADGNGDREMSSGALEEGKTYIVPLTFYNYYGNLQTGAMNPTSTGVWGILDDIALVTKNGDGTYHVTLQVENYKKIDIFQVSKPGAIPDETRPDDAPMGTYNIPEKYFRTNPEAKDESGQPTDESGQITAYLQGQGKMDESWNDKYFQQSEVEVAEGSAGVCRYSFDVDTLDSFLYVKSFYSYGNTRKPSASNYWQGFASNNCICAGKFLFDTKQMDATDDLAPGTYGDLGFDISKVDITTHRGAFNHGASEKTANDFLAGQASAVVDSGGKWTVTGRIAEGAGLKSVQVLAEIKDYGEEALYTDGTFWQDSRFLEYKYAYSKETVTFNKEKVPVSVYSDNCLEDGTFTVEYPCLQEALFGREIKITAENGSVYYGELRVKTTPKQELKFQDGDVALVTDNYTLSSQSEFRAELVQETTDEDSEYNVFYSLLAGNAAKALIYKVSLNNEQVTLTRGVDLRVKIPDGWEKDKIEVQWSGDIWYKEAFNPIEYVNESPSYKNEDGSIRMDGDELVIKNLQSVFGAIAVTQKADKADISEIQDGNYKVNVTMWQEQQPDRLSMSNSAVISDSARLTVSGNGAEKWIYFDTQGVTIANTYGYANGILWADNKEIKEEGKEEEGGETIRYERGEFTPLEYYSYYLTGSGSTQMDDYARNYGLYYPKTVGFRLPASADRDDGAYLEFCVPIMDELQGKEPGSGEGSRVAFMTLSGLEPQLELIIPGHDASVLVVASDKASKYSEDDYTDESYLPLSDALARAQKIIDGSQAASDSEITALDKEIADAVSGLVKDEQKKENVRTELSQAVANAKNNYKEADYTAESFQKLTDAIEKAEKTLEAEDASVSEMRTQTASLQEAISTLEEKGADPGDEELAALVESALKEQNNGMYTEKSWNSFQAALASAQKILEDKDAPEAEKNKQKALLLSARGALVPADRQSGLFEGYPNIYPGTYSTAVKLLNAMTQEDSMGNPAMEQTGIIRVSGQGEMALELDFHSLQFAGLTGYLYKMRKVDMDTVEKNEYEYPEKYEAAEVQILEEYTDTRDLFNDPSSQYYDQKTEGKWYPKKISFPIQPGDNLFYVEVYVPVMESIGEGQGTKVARLSIDWENLKQETGVQRDDSALDALLAQVSSMSMEGMAETCKNALQAALASAQEIRGDLNATQEEINAQRAALQAAVDAAGAQEQPGEDPKAADKTALEQAIAKAREEAGKTSVYTAESIEALNRAIEQAQEVYGKADARQEEVDAQAAALDKAVTALVKQPEEDPKAADKTALEQAIAKAREEAGKTSVYTAESIEALNRAIEQAQEVYGKADARQEEVDAQAAALDKAVTALVKQPAKEPENPGDDIPKVTRPAAPSKVKAVSGAYDRATISWSSVGGAAGYEVYQYNGSTKKYSSIASVTGTSYTRKGLKTGTKYTWRVRAYKNDGDEKVYSPYSQTVSAKPALKKATGVKVENSKGKKAKISWKKVSGASGYKVYRSTKKNGGFKKAAAIKKGGTVKYTDKKLKKGRTYYYKVKAYRTVGGKKVYAPYSDSGKVKIRK